MVLSVKWSIFRGQTRELYIPRGIHFVWCLGDVTVGKTSLHKLYLRGQILLDQPVEDVLAVLDQVVAWQLAMVVLIV